MDFKNDLFLDLKFTSKIICILNKNKDLKNVFFHKILMLKNEVFGQNMDFLEQYEIYFSRVIELSEKTKRRILPSYSATS